MNNLIRKTGLVILLVLLLALPQKRLDYAFFWRRHHPDRTLPAARIDASPFFNTADTRRTYCCAMARSKRLSRGTDLNSFTVHVYKARGYMIDDEGKLKLITRRFGVFVTSCSRNISHCIGYALADNLLLIGALVVQRLRRHSRCRRTPARPTVMDQAKKRPGRVTRASSSSNGTKRPPIARAFRTLVQQNSDTSASSLVAHSGRSRASRVQKGLDRFFSSFTRSLNRMEKKETKQLNHLVKFFGDFEYHHYFEIVDHLLSDVFINFTSLSVLAGFAPLPCL